MSPGHAIGKFSFADSRIFIYFTLMRKLILLFIVLFLSACACGKSERDSGSDAALTGLIGDSGGSVMTKARGSVPANAKGERSMQLDQVDVLGWIDNPSAVFALDGNVDEASSEPGDGDYAEAVARTKSARMVNYHGFARLESPEPEAVIDTVVQRATAAGGAIHSRRIGFVSLQIPVSVFKPFFESVLSLGRVTDKGVSARDITEAFADNAAALRIAESTLARLQELLAAATTEIEKLELLREIQRISEQIEQQKLREKELLNQAKFSTIELSVRNTPLPQPIKFNFNAFEWFASLTMNHCNALNSIRINSTQKSLSIDTPPHFVKVQEDRCAASARNSEFFAFERENDPQGSADFWTSAMLEYFKTLYQTELKKEENYSLIRLQSYGVNPKVIYIAVLNSPDPETLKIACAFFPNAEAEKADAKAILEVLGRTP